MVEVGDIHNLLQNGYWPTNNRARSPRFSSPTTPSSYSYNDGVVPRTSPILPQYYKKKYGGHRSGFKQHYPPPPSVEDEAESVAKEFGSVVSAHPDEEPQHRGEVEQYPILHLLHEHNPERRFVLVSNRSSSASSSYSSDESIVGTDGNKQQSQAERRRRHVKRGDEARDPRQRQPQRKSSYEANTCRKYVLLTPDEEEDKTRKDRRGKRTNRERRRSRLEDLPTIITDFPSNDRTDERAIRRPKSANIAEQESEDYFSPRRSAQRPLMTPNESSMLSPEVIKHSTKGRDRAYWDYSGGVSSAPSTAQSRNRPIMVHDSQHGTCKSPSNRRRDGDSAEPRRSSTSPVMAKRHSTMDVPKYTRRAPKDDHEKGRLYPDSPPSKLDRVMSDPRYSRPEREALQPRSASFRGKRDSPPRDQGHDRYSSDDDTPRRNVSRRWRKSMLYDDGNGYLATPTEARPMGGRKSRPASPLASPVTPQSDLHEKTLSPSPRSATFPRESKKFHPGYPPDDEPIERPLSRASTARASIKTPNPAAVAAMNAAATAAAASASASSTTPVIGFNPVSPVERRRSPIPTPQARRTADLGSELRSSTPASSLTPPTQTWQPPKFDPVQNGSHSDKPITSYRRYSEDVNKGELPEIPDCPRTREEAGHVDWFTLPRSNNFNICPSCYQSAFEQTEYRNHLVPAPFRPFDRPLKCDFGASQWYHIAWLLTHKYKQPDLRLFHGIANVAAANQPCTGLTPAYRIWYTIKEPTTQRPIRNFNICHNCAKTIEVLLPNLSGVFVPHDSPAEPTRGICDMHQQGYGGGVRKRFVEYFDMTETISDQALATGRAPDIRSLAERVRVRSQINECMNSQILSGAQWFTMRSIPDVTVCQECFYEVVWPELERNDGGVQGNFLLRPQQLQAAACQLYSPRMRDAFKRAVERNDLRYFESKVRQRRTKEQELTSRIVGLDKQVLGAEWVDEEVQRCQRGWRGWE